MADPYAVEEKAPGGSAMLAKLRAKVKDVALGAAIAGKGESGEEGGGGGSKRRARDGPIPADEIESKK
jgi:hypothetical protein